MDDVGQTALHIAVSADARDQDDKFLRLLLDHHCPVDAADAEVPSLPQYLRRVQAKSIILVMIFIFKTRIGNYIFNCHHAMIDLAPVMARQGRTALHHCADQGRVSTTRKLLAAGASPILKSTHGFTALDVANWCAATFYNQKCDCAGVAPMMAADGTRTVRMCFGAGNRSVHRSATRAATARQQQQHPAIPRHSTCGGAAV